MIIMTMIEMIIMMTKIILIIVVVIMINSNQVIFNQVIFSLDPPLTDIWEIILYLQANPY